MTSGDAGFGETARAMAEALRALYLVADGDPRESGLLASGRPLL